MGDGVDGAFEAVDHVFEGVALGGGLVGGGGHVLELIGVGEEADEGVGEVVGVFVFEGLSVGAGVESDDLGVV